MTLALQTSMPLPWRKYTPLHKKLGARAMRYIYPLGVGLPIAGSSPATLNFRGDAVSTMDRVLGFTLSIQKVATASDFLLQELNTGWFQSYSYAGTRGLFLANNIETLPDEVSLQWSFSVAMATNVYLSFTNIELVPCIHA